MADKKKDEQKPKPPKREGDDEIVGSL